MSAVYDRVSSCCTPCFGFVVGGVKANRPPPSHQAVFASCLVDAVMTNLFPSFFFSAIPEGFVVTLVGSRESYLDISWCGGVANILQYS